MGPRVSAKMKPMFAALHLSSRSINDVSPIKFSVTQISEYLEMSSAEKSVATWTST